MSMLFLLNYFHIVIQLFILNQTYIIINTFYCSLEFFKKIKMFKKNDQKSTFQIVLPGGQT